MVAILLASTVAVSAIGFEAEKVYEAVFVVYSGDALGSGFAIGQNCIVTNAHVIDDSQHILIESYDGTEYTAEILGLNEENDIAILVVESATFPYLNIADLSTMKIGDDIYAIGSPKGMAYTLTKGSISAKERVIGNQSYLQIDAAINEGNSGGPLLNDSGQVLGMNTLKMFDSEGIGLAISISDICDYLLSLGIPLNEERNVTDRVAAPEQAPLLEADVASEEKGKEEEPAPPEDASTLAITYAAIVIALLSLVCNVFLMGSLINEKKRCASLQYDPTARTDFEIEILE